MGAMEEDWVAILERGLEEDGAVPVGPVHIETELSTAFTAVSDIQACSIATTFSQQGQKKKECEQKRHEARVTLRPYNVGTSKACV